MAVVGELLCYVPRKVSDSLLERECPSRGTEDRGESQCQAGVSQTKGDDTAQSSADPNFSDILPLDVLSCALTSMVSS